MESDIVTTQPATPNTTVNVNGSTQPADMGLSLGWLKNLMNASAIVVIAYLVLRNEFTSDKRYDQYVQQAKEDRALFREQSKEDRATFSEQLSLIRKEVSVRSEKVELIHRESFNKLTSEITKLVGGVEKTLKVVEDSNRRVKEPPGTGAGGPGG